MDARKIINAELERRKWTPYRLYRELADAGADKIAPTTIRDYLDPPPEGRDIHSDTLCRILSILGISMVKKHEKQRILK